MSQEFRAKIHEQLADLLSMRVKLLVPVKNSEVTCKMVDDNAHEILRMLKLRSSYLDVDEIIQALTKIGDAPSILYDDDGHFAVGSDGNQSVLTEDDKNTITGFSGDWIIPSKAWKRTIREAVKFYLESK